MDRAEASRELGVAPRAEPALIERAFRRAARARHPDLGGDPADFRRAIEAREVLLRPVPRDPLIRAVEVVIRYHPVLRMVDVLVRVAERRPVR